MTHLYLVVRLFGAIIASIGPFPNDEASLAECRAQATRAKMSSSYILDEFSEVAGRRVESADIQVDCLPFRSAPLIEDPK